MYEDQYYTQQLSASFEISPQTAWRRLEWQHLSGSEDYNLHEHLVDGDHIKITATSGSEEFVSYTHIMELQRALIRTITTTRITVFE